MDIDSWIGSDSYSSLRALYRDSQHIDRSAPPSASGWSVAKAVAAGAAVGSLHGQYVYKSGKLKLFSLRSSRTSMDNGLLVAKSFRISQRTYMIQSALAIGLAAGLLQCVYNALDDWRLQKTVNDKLRDLQPVQSTLTPRSTNAPPTPLPKYEWPVWQRFLYPLKYMHYIDWQPPLWLPIESKEQREYKEYLAAKERLLMEEVALLEKRQRRRDKLKV
jgi:hypothetical protein